VAWRLQKKPKKGLLRKTKTNAKRKVETDKRKIRCEKRIEDCDPKGSLADRIIMIEPPTKTELVSRVQHNTI